jgi:hypothetical protein
MNSNTALNSRADTYLCLQSLTGLVVANSFNTGPFFWGDLEVRCSHSRRVPVQGPGPTKLVYLNTNTTKQLREQIDFFVYKIFHKGCRVLYQDEK